MAKVTLTFAGDTSQLEKSTKQAGDTTEAMSDQVGASSTKMSRAGQATDKLTGGLTNVDSKSRDARDMLDGSVDVFQAFSDENVSLTDRLSMAGRGVGDIASGISGVLIPAVTLLVGFLKTGLMTTLSAIAAHPIVAALIALGALFVLLWVKSETFRDIVKGVFDAVWEAVKATGEWIKNAWTSTVDAMSAAAQRLGDFFGGIWDTMKAGAKGALNFVIDMLNKAIDALNKPGDLLSSLPGVDVPDIPHVPKLHDGGTVPGDPGEEVLALLQAGETVIPADAGGGASGGGASVSFKGNTDTAVASMIMKLIRKGDLQIG